MGQRMAPGVDAEFAFRRLPVEKNGPGRESCSGHLHPGFRVSLEVEKPVCLAMNHGRKMSGVLRHFGGAIFCSG